MAVALTKQTRAAVAPIAIAPATPTYPEAGVTVASPATAPVITPSTLGRPWRAHSTNIQTVAAVAADTWVAASVMPAVPFAASALPALNPNQPTHSMPAPTTESVRLCGIIGVVGYPFRLPT